LFETIKDMTESETKVASIVDMRTYILNHFESERTIIQVITSDAVQKAILVISILIG